MDKIVANLPFTDEPTKVIIQELVIRKKLHQKKKANYKFIMLIAVISTIMLVSNFLIMFYSVDSHSAVGMYALFRNDTLTFVLFLATIASMLLVKFYRVGLTDAKADYKALRLEVVQKSTDLWQEVESWNHRHKVFQELKKEYDINLFYEND